MRLTKKYKDGYHNCYYTTGQMSSGIVYLTGKKFTNAAINKLGEIEDLGEKLGIDSNILLKALTNGVAVKLGNQIRFIPKNRISIHRSCLFVNYIMPQFLYFKDYGKMWALTKQELEEKR